MAAICSYGNCGNELIGTEEKASGICSMHIEEKTEREIEEEKEYIVDMIVDHKYHDTFKIKCRGYEDKLAEALSVAHNRVSVEIK